MHFTLDEAWLMRSVELEDAAGCDIQAGPNLGSDAGAYLAAAESYITPDKLMAVLQEELGGMLSQDDLDFIATTTQRAARARVFEKYHSAKIA
ncbi:MAG TPA: hypothetical protein ACFE0H_14415 [Elainellaceae cyanobacterium]